MSQESRKGNKRKKCSLCFLKKKSKQIHSNKPGLLKEKDYEKKYTQICAKLSRCKHVQTKFLSRKRVKKCKICPKVDINVKSVQ